MHCMAGRLLAGRSIIVCRLPQHIFLFKLVQACGVYVISAADVVILSKIIIGKTSAGCKANALAVRKQMRYGYQKGPT